MAAENEEDLLRSAAVKNAASILAARRRAEEELIQAKDALELKTQELAHSLSLMHATLEATKDGILVTEENGKITHFNQKYIDMWRIPVEIVHSKNDHRIVQFKSRQFRDPQQYIDDVEKIYSTSPLQSSHILELADGRIFERFTRLQFVNGQKAGRVWSYRDITEQRQAEEALRDETRMLELLNQTGSALAAKLDLQALLQSITDAATALSGAKFGAFFYTAKDENGDAFMLYTLSGAPREAFESFGYPRATQLFGPTLRGEGTIRINDVLADPRYGKMAPHHGMPPGHLPVRSYLAVPVIARSGEVIGGLFFGHPEPGVFTARSERLISGVAAQGAIAIDNARLYEAAQRSAEERKHLLDSERFARAEAVRMGEMKDEFLATLSHELRTPLSAILGWAQVLRHGGQNQGDMMKGLETIERNAKIQTRLIEDLLDMNQITSGKVCLDMQLVEPVSFIEAALETVKPAADAKGIRLEKLLDASAGRISGDPNRLQQVVWNLLSNAIKFTPNKGTVRLELQRTPAHIEISISDSGIGIAPDFLTQVFERFRQADASTTRKYGGLGLGLAIVKNLVELHGGTVQANSPGEGRGATFTVRLPLAAAQTDAHREQQLRTDASTATSADFRTVDLSGIGILVVDDEPDARDLVMHMLMDCNAQVFAAGNAGEALQLLERENPQVLVSDIGMPDVDGFELLLRIRSLGQTRGGNIPAIALTAFARPQDRERALQTGFCAHIAKPVDPTELVKTIADIALNASGDR